MIERILNNNNEDCIYPLTEYNTVYPNNLITECKLMVPGLRELFIESVAIFGVTVSVTLSATIDSWNGDPVHKYIYGASTLSGVFPIVYLYDADTDARIGWLTLGSGCRKSCQYAQKVRLAGACFYIENYTRDASVYVNGIRHTVPESLDIIVTGDLYVEHTDKGYKICNSKLSSTGYDSNGVDRTGGIITVNGNIPDDRTIHIELPKHRNSEDKLEDIFTFTVDYRDAVTIITIDTIEGMEQYAAVFGCPDSDILLDKVTQGSAVITGSELPLDAFIDWYKKNKES